jgi:hypothetical protein
MRSATQYLIATRQAERALKAGGDCAPSFRLRTSAASAQAWPAAPYLLNRLVLPGMQPRLAGVRVPPAVGRGAGASVASPLLNGDESWMLPPASSSIGAGLIAYFEINPGQSGRPRGETSCPCWTTCAACVPLEPRTAKRGVPRPASEPPTCRPCAFSRKKRGLSELLRRRKRPRLQLGTTAPERRRDD